MKYNIFNFVKNFIKNSLKKNSNIELMPPKSNVELIHKPKQSLALCIHIKEHVKVLNQTESDDKMDLKLNPIFIYILMEDNFPLDEKQLFEDEMHLLSKLKKEYLSLPNKETKVQFIISVKKRFIADPDVVEKIDMIFLFLDGFLKFDVEKFFVNVSNNKHREGLQVLLGAEMTRIVKNNIRTRGRYYFYDREKIPFSFNDPIQLNILLFENDHPKHLNVMYECCAGYAGNRFGCINNEGDFLDISGLLVDKPIYVEFTGNALDVLHGLHCKNSVYEKDESNKDFFNLANFNPIITDIPFSGGFSHIEKANCNIHVRVFFDKTYRLTSIVYFFDIYKHNYRHINSEHNVKYFSESVTFLKKDHNI